MINKLIFSNFYSVTWNLNFLSDYAFTPMPRTTLDTTAAGFDFKDDFCGGSTIRHNGKKEYSNYETY